MASNLRQTAGISHRPQGSPFSGVSFLGREAGWFPGAALLTGCTLAANTLHGLDMDDVLSAKVGGVLIQPRVAVAESYNDNIFYRPSKPTPGFPPEVVDDFLTVVSPGISFQVGRDEGNFINLDYGMTGLYYVDNSDQNASDHAVALRLRYAGAKFQISGQDRVEFQSSIYGGGWTVGTKLDRFSLSDSYTFSYQATEKTRGYARGDFSMQDFRDVVRLYDVNTVRGTLGGGYQYSPKLDFFSETYYGQSASDPNSPLDPKGPYSWFVGGFLGANGEFTARLSGTLKLGYEARGYGDGTDAPGGLVMEAAVLHRLSEKTTTSLQYRRGSYASVQFSKYSYVRDAVSVKLDQMIGKTGRLMGTVNASFEFDDYDPSPTVPDRADQRVLVNASLAYQLKLWMFASLNYEFETFSSDVAGVIDYDVNRVTVQLSIGY